MIFLKTDSITWRVYPLEVCFDFLKRSSNNYELGKRYDLQDGIYCSIISYKTDDSSINEAHKKYVDLHCVLSGTEYMYVGFTDESEVGEYVEEKDFLPIHSVSSNRILLTPGTAIGLFPNDAHMGKISPEEGQPVTVIKAIFKIPVELFVSKKR